MRYLERYLRGALLLVAAALSGCTMHYVSSAAIKPVDSPIGRVLIVIQNGTFNGAGMASGYGNQNLHSLVPHLQSRLPVIFDMNGIQTRAVISEKDNKERVPLSKDEALMYIAPVSAFYSTQSGQHLKLRALLLEAKTGQPVWRADINLSTPGFGKFDAELADKVAVDLLEKLREDQMIQVPDGPIRTGKTESAKN